MPHHEHRRHRPTSSTLDLSAPFVRRGEDEAIRSMARVGVEAFEALLAVYAESETGCPRCQGSGVELDRLDALLLPEPCSVCLSGACWRLFDIESEEINGYPTNEDAAHYEYERERNQGVMVELHHRNEQGEWEVIR